MSWLETLFSFLRQLIPWVVVRDGEAGVRFVFGKSRGPYPPGWYFSTPMLYQMVSHFAEHRVINLLSMSVTTKDGVPVTLSANITYRTHDARLSRVMVQEPEGAMGQEAMKAVHRCARRVPFPKLLASQRSLERGTMRTLQRTVTDWGITVLDVGLTDLVRASQHRLFVDPPVKEAG